MLGTLFRYLLLASVVGAVSAPAFAAETDPPQEYCQLQDRYAAIEQEASERFPDVTTNDKWLARKEWTTTQSEAASDEFGQVVGKPYKEWFYIAFENHWTAACEAALSGWPIVRQSNLVEVSSSDIQRVRDAITLEYLDRMASPNPDPFFDPERYSAVNCSEAELSGFQFVGCRLRSMSYQTDRDIYLVANVGGVIFAAPYTSEAKSRVKGRSMLAKGDQAIRLGYFVGEMPLVEYEQLITELD